MSKVFNKVSSLINELVSSDENIFMHYIYHKKQYSLSRWIEYRNFLKYLDKCSPDFYMLWHICEFVKILERVYMYHNDPKESKIYTYNTTKAGVNSFLVNNKDEGYSIEYTLYANDKIIAISVKRNWGDAIRTDISFKDGQRIDFNNNDSILIYNIINWTMQAVKELFVTQYNKIKAANIYEEANKKNKEVFEHSKGH